MAGGIDWYRAHHGIVEDSKFGVVAKRSGQRRGDVIAMWHWLMERASAAEDRGNPGIPDCESIDLLLEMEEGGARAIYDAFLVKNMIDAKTGRLTAWDRRQVKREREGDNSTERVQKHRAQKAGASGPGSHETPGNTKGDPETPRGEERREEDSDAHASAGKPAVDKSSSELTKTELWAAGKSILLQQGVPDAQCGSFVGKLCKDYGDEIVIEAVRCAVSTVPADAREYLKATCQRMKGERTQTGPPITVTSSAPDKTRAYLDQEAQRAVQPVSAENRAAAIAVRDSLARKRHGNQDQGQAQEAG